MSSFILQKVPKDGSWFSEVSDTQIAKCGVLFCSDINVEENTNLDRPETIKVKILFYLSQLLQYFFHNNLLYKKGFHLFYRSTHCVELLLVLEFWQLLQLAYL